MRPRAFSTLMRSQEQWSLSTRALEVTLTAARGPTVNYRVLR